MSIADKIIRLQDARDDIAVALYNKGMIVPAGAGFEDFPDIIDTFLSIEGMVLDPSGIVPVSVSYSVREGATAIRDTQSLVSTLPNVFIMNNTTIQEIYFPAVVNLNNDTARRWFMGCTALTTVNMPAVRAIYNSSGGDCFNGCTALQTIRLPALVELEKGNNSDGRDFMNCTNLRTCELPSLTWAGGGSMFANDTNLQRVQIGTLTGKGGGFGNTWFTRCVNLIDIEVGSNYNIATTLNDWNPTNVLSDATKITTLNTNITNHIANKLYNLTGSTAKTFGFNSAVKAVLTTDTLAAFAAKNWTVA